MGHKLSVDMRLGIDSSTGKIKDISSSVNSMALSAAFSILEDSAMGDEERTYLPGLAGATVDLSGFLNTTTDDIFGPLVGNRTSVTKTVEFTPYSGQYLQGEVYPTSVGISGSPDSLEVWSASLTFNGSVHRTNTSR